MVGPVKFAGERQVFPSSRRTPRSPSPIAPVRGLCAKTLLPTFEGQERVPPVSVTGPVKVGFAPTV